MSVTKYYRCIQRKLYYDLTVELADVLATVSMIATPSIGVVVFTPDETQVADVLRFRGYNVVTVDRGAILVHPSEATGRP